MITCFRRIKQLSARIAGSFCVSSKIETDNRRRKFLECKEFLANDRLTEDEKCAALLNNVLSTEWNYYDFEDFCELFDDFDGDFSDTVINVCKKLTPESLVSACNQFNENHPKSPFSVIPRLAKAWCIKINNTNDDDIQSYQRDMIDEYSSKIGLCGNNTKIIGDAPPKCGIIKDWHQQLLLQINCNDLPQDIKQELLNPSLHNSNYLIQLFGSNARNHMDRCDILWKSQYYDPMNTHLTARYVQFKQKNSLTSENVKCINDQETDDQILFDYATDSCNQEINVEFSDCQSKIQPILFNDSTKVVEQPLQWNGYFVKRPKNIISSNTDTNCAKNMNEFDVSKSIQLCSVDEMREMEFDCGMGMTDYDTCLYEQNYIDIKMGGFPCCINDACTQWYDVQRNCDILCNHCNTNVPLYDWNLLVSMFNNMTNDHDGKYKMNSNSFAFEEGQREFYLLICNHCKIGLATIYDLEYGGG